MNKDSLGKNLPLLYHHRVSMSPVDAAHPFPDHPALLVGVRRVKVGKRRLLQPAHSLQIFWGIEKAPCSQSALQCAIMLV